MLLHRQDLGVVFDIVRFEQQHARLLRTGASKFKFVRGFPNVE